MHTCNVQTAPAQDIDPRLLAQRVKALGLRQTALSSAVGASQSQVSRALAGRANQRSRVFARICDYVFHLESRQSNPGRSLLPDDLMEAIAAVWNGTPRHAAALALVIRSLGALEVETRQPPASVTRKKRER